jgi:transposase-like protein
MDVHKNAGLTPRGRAELVRRVLELGQAPGAVATDFGVSCRTVRKWVKRFRAEGPAGRRGRADQRSVEGLKVAAERIGDVVKLIQDTASAAEEQAAATQEIARKVQQAAAGTGEVSSNIAGVTQVAGETGRMSNEVLQASSDLARQAEVLGKEVDGFLASVRAA